MNPLEWVMASILAVYALLLVMLGGAFVWVAFIVFGWLRELAREARASSEAES